MIQPLAIGRIGWPAPSAKAVERVRVVRRAEPGASDDTMADHGALRAG